MELDVSLAVGDHDWRMLIGGELVHALDGGTLDVIDPAHGTIIARVPAALEADVDLAVAAASKAFASWKRTPATERAALVLRIADIVEEHREELTRLDVLDGGHSVTVMAHDVHAATRALRYYAGLALEMRGETVPTPNDDSIDFTRREPWGVVARINPFNHPLLFAIARSAAPLVAGNTLIVKPSEHTSLSALRFGELVQEVMPPGVLSIVTGLGGVAGDRLVTHPDVRRIGFTGGAEVGRRILARSTLNSVKMVTLELGGKNPIIVFEDADFEAAVEAAVSGMNFTYLGQSCGSTSRLYVHRSLFDAFVKAVAARLDKFVVGDPLDPASDMGAVAYRAHYDKIVHYLNIGIEDPNVRLVTGGIVADPPDPDGLFVRPTLFALDNDDSVLAKEEIFGPILCAMPFDSELEVTERANSSQYGLTASVWTKDLGKAMRMSRDLEVGYVWVNAVGMHIPGTPYGGYKNSGIGRDMGAEELMDFTQKKNVYIRY
jgi:betaine-aldehyde dehydrogenase